MKNHLKTFWAIALILGFAVQSYAQDSIKTPLTLGKIEPYKFEITYDKTSHLIFPTAIRYVDLGSEYLIAGKAEDAEKNKRLSLLIPILLAIKHTYDNDDQLNITSFLPKRSF